MGHRQKLDAQCSPSLDLGPAYHSVRLELGARRQAVTMGVRRRLGSCSLWIVVVISSGLTSPPLSGHHLQSSHRIAAADYDRSPPRHRMIGSSHGDGMDN